MSVHSTSIWNSLTLETAQTSIRSWINKEIVAYPCNGYYSAKKRNEIFIHVTPWMNLMGELCWVKEARQKKDYILYGAIYIFI